MVRKEARLSSPDASSTDDTYRYLRIALGAMPQGLCLYDRDDRLRLWNARFSRLYELEGRLRVGMHLDDVIGLTVSAGKYGKQPRADILRHRHAFIERREEARLDQVLDTGTIVEIVHVPLEDGGWVATFEDVTALRSTQRQLVHLANHDQLTGLANRRKFTDVATRLLAGTAAGATTLVLMDLDGFKTVNDSLGHAAGDMLLKEVAERLRSAAADACLIARVGGDEFALLYDTAIALAARHPRTPGIADTVLGTTHIDDIEITIDASFGMAVSDAGMTLDALVAKADAALYDHKRCKRVMR